MNNSYGVFVGTNFRGIMGSTIKSECLEVQISEI